MKNIKALYGISFACVAAGVGLFSYGYFSTSGTFNSSVDKFDRDVKKYNSLKSQIMNEEVIVSYSKIDNLNSTIGVYKEENNNIFKYYRGYKDRFYKFSFHDEADLKEVNSKGRKVPTVNSYEGSYVTQTRTLSRDAEKSKIALPDKSSFRDDISKSFENFTWDLSNGNKPSVDNLEAIQFKFNLCTNAVNIVKQVKADESIKTKVQILNINTEDDSIKTNSNAYFDFDVFNYYVEVLIDKKHVGSLINAFLVDEKILVDYKSIDIRRPGCGNGLQPPKREKRT